MWVIALFACGCGRLRGDLTLPADVTIATEPTLDATAEVPLVNGTRRDVAVTGISLDPASAPATWGGEGPWDDIAPGDERDVRVYFRPDVEGTWDVTLTLQTSEGPRTSTLHLVSAVGVDDDGDGSSAAMGDCDDGDPSVHPDAPEVCNGVDDDCNGEVDEGFDHDGDGHKDASACADGDDCNDADPTTYPGHPEDCDAADSDCNGVVDDTTAPADLQQGVCAGATKVCVSGSEREPDYGLIDGYQAAEHACDGLDNDCDGLADVFDLDHDGTPDCVDDDGDGFAEADGDCDDQDASIVPADCGATRLVVTDTTAGFTTVDLDLGVGDAHDLGGALYDAVQVSPGHMWFTDRSGVLLEADVTTGDVAWGETLDGHDWGMVADPDRASVWVALYEGEALRMDDAGHVGAEWSVDADAVGLALDGSGRVWACGDLGGLTRIDPDTHDVTGIGLDQGCYGPPIVDEAHRRVLVLGYLEDQIVAVDMDTLLVTETWDVDQRPLRGEIAGDGLLWVATGVDGGVRAYDPDDMSVVHDFELGGQTTDVWVDDVRGDVWASVYDLDEVVRIDPADGTILDTVPSPGPMLLEPLFP